MPATKVASNRKPPNAGKGRTKGALNKSTKSVKAALTEAFEKMGGAAALVRWGVKDENRGEFYKLWAKMLPTEVTGADGAPIAIRVIFEDIVPE